MNMNFQTLCVIQICDPWFLQELDLKILEALAKKVDIFLVYQSGFFMK